MILAAAPVFGGIYDDGPTERKSLRIYQTVEPQFPTALVQRGITSGWATLAISVDDEGQLRDYLPIAYTERTLATAAAEALRHWKFDPMRVRGEPVGAQVDLTFKFEAVGVVVSVDPLSNPLLRGFVSDMQVQYMPCNLRDLDSVPTPIDAPAPAYPKELQDRGVSGRVVIDFYIDESGAVRLPAVVDADFMELGAFAVSAVRTWKFEPATSKGEPVLARVRQTFRFLPENKS